MTLVEQIVRWWEEERIAVPGVAAAAIAAFERRYSVRLPTDFRQHLRLSNGTVTGGGDDLISFAQLDDIRPVVDACGTADAGHDLYPECFVFADWALHCWDFAMA